MTEYSLPKRVDLEDLMTILKAYYTADAHEEPKPTAEIESLAGMPDRVGRQTGFLTELGLVEKEGNERLLTETGSNIAEPLLEGNSEQAAARMKVVLEEWPLTTSVGNYVRIQEEVSNDTLMNYLSDQTGSSNDRSLRVIIDLLKWSGIIEQKGADGGYTIQESPFTTENSKSDPSKSDNPQSQSVSQEEGDKGGETTNQMPTKATTISFQLEFTTDDSDEEIERVISTVHDAVRKIEIESPQEDQ